MTLLNATGWTLIHFLLASGGDRRAICDCRLCVSHRIGADAVAIGSFAMMLMLGSAVTTFVYFLKVLPSDFATPAPIAPMVIGLSSIPHSSSGYPELPADYLPWLVYVWTAGVTVLSLRLVIQWLRLSVAGGRESVS